MKPSAIIYLLWDKNIRVLDAYLAQDNCTILTLASNDTPTIREVVKRYKSRVIRIEDFVTPSAKKQLKEESLQLASKYRHVNDTSISQQMADCLANTLNNDLEYSIQIIYALNQVFSHFFIELIAVNEDYMQIARAIVLWGKQHNIPTLHLSHGAALVQPYTVHGHADADITAVFGERVLDGYLDLGITQDRLSVTGNPAWDCYAQMSSEHSDLRKQLLSAHECDNENPLVVFATTWSAGLTAKEDQSIPACLIREMFKAYQNLTRKVGLVFNLVIKDRGHAQHVLTGYKTILKIAEELGLSEGDFIYETQNTVNVVSAAHVLIACDSNILIEAMLAGVPAVNLINLNGLRLGPPFYSDSGVVEVEPSLLEETLQTLLEDESYRNNVVEKAYTKVSLYNRGVDGLATKRVVDLMLQMKKVSQDSIMPSNEFPRDEISPTYVWKVLDKSSSAVTNIEADYHHHIRYEIMDFFKFEPKVVLDVGCAAGVTGGEIKKRHSGVHVIGIELNKASVKLARQRIDRVIEGSIEDIDLLNYGLPFHSIDTVILADVLEHMLNPWAVMTKLKNFLTKDAQVLVSIPNARNFWLLNHLANGFWRYEAEGLLDVTHVRFFTWQEVQRFFYETGYDILKAGNTWDARLTNIAPNKSGNLETDKLIIKNINETELRELKTLQFLVLAQPNLQVQTGEEAADYYKDTTFETSGQPGSKGSIWNQALKVHELVGGSFIGIVSSILKNSFPGHHLEDVKNMLFCEVANKFLTELKLQAKNNEDIKLSCKFGSTGEVIALLRERLLDELSNREIRDVLNRLYEFEETYYYQLWIAGHALLEIDGQLFAERMMLQWQSRPVFHLVLYLFPGENELLADTIDSLAAQMYQQWRFSVIAGEPCPDPIFDQFEIMQWVQVRKGDNPYDVLNSTIADVDADWVAVIEPGATFQPHALLRFGDYIHLNKDWRFFYADEDVLGSDGLRKKPKFKPDFNLDLLRSDFYIGGFCVIAKETLLELGGFQPTPDFENYDLAFKVFENYGTKAFCHIADVLYHDPEASLRTPDNHIKRIVVENHLIRTGVMADVNEGYQSGTQRVVYHHAETPKVSIIIPTRDKLEFFQPCIESLMEKTDYPDFEVLVVNNQSRDPDVLRYFEELLALYFGRVRILDYDKEFNFSAISNLAAKHADGQYLLFLNNDTEIIQPEWLSRMMSHAQRPEIGIVGARLVLPEKGLVQHVGVVLGLDLVADHPYSGLLDIQSPGYMGRALLDQNYSAVTGACLLVRSEVYQTVGGMDEENFPISYNDIDLCLKVKQAGFEVVWTPYATLIHHSSVSQKSERNPEEIARRNAIFWNSKDKMFAKWRKIIANDPAYNRNLSLIYRDFRVDSSLPSNWDVNFHDRQRVLGLPLPGGAGDYRVILPFEALSRSGLMQCEYIRLQANQSRRLNAVEIERLAPDTLLIHSAINDVELKYLDELKRYNKDLFIVFALDDLITQIPQKSSVYRKFMRHYRDAKPRLRKALSMCDRLVVSTDPLAELCADMIDDIRIIPNRLNKDVWCDLQSLRKQGTKPRVGWAGAQQHQGDLEIIFEVVKETADEIDWVFMGMCPEELAPFVKESHGYVPFDKYPAKLASLNLDLAIAPLEECQFNDAKSNLRLLEYGILAWPVICSDVYPYRSYDAPVVRVKNETQAWLTAIRTSLSDMDRNYLAGDRLREWVLEKFILEDHLDEWQRAFTR